MNLLPMVFVFITLLSLLSYHMVSQTYNNLQQQRIASGFLKAERKLLNARYQSIYKASSLPKKNQGNTLSSSSHLQRGKGGYFNLYYLFDSATEKMTMQCLANIFTNAYGPYEPFYALQTPDTLHQFIVSLQRTGQAKLKDNSKRELGLIDLFPKETHLHFIYYKMLKGTLPYKKHHISYPPLEKVFIVKKNAQQKLFNFSHLSYSQLRWIFGQAICLDIEKKEVEINATLDESKQRTLNHKELQDILLQHRYENSSAILANISFNSHKPASDPLTGMDQNTQISLTWEDSL